ncbi:RHS repeat domain-containing protein [Chryseobacterium sp. CT-SW4]|uniref:RHS repeat domain-containing protein n=1 Tax=Chryseobacterium sp. SW-1 TaxID=3157343 RepID=UPI003B01218D
MKKILLIVFAIFAVFVQAQTKKHTTTKQKTEKKWVNPVKLTKEERNRPYMDEVLKTRDSLTPTEAERRRKNIAIGNPFAKYGVYPKIATLSKGKYLEFHDMDSVVSIGSIRFNRKTKSITEFREIDLSDPDAQPYLDTAGRWISPDPLSEEFPSWSPYNYAFNNPLKFVDPDGRAPEEVNGCCWWLRLMPLFENSSVRPSPVVEIATKSGEGTTKTNDHHIIPRQFKNTDVVKEARKQGFEFEGKENKVELEQFSKSTGEGRHANHPKYNKQMGELLKEIPKSEALTGLRNLKDKAKDIINSNPDTKINDLKLKTAPPVKTDNLQNTTPPPAVLPKITPPLTPSQKCARDPNCV